MTRRYSLVIEGDEAGYSAFVPELPSILVTGRSMEELTERASEAIQAYWEAVREDWPAAGITKEIEVELPAGK
jgi:predicted RNase H-like HicB family nuclease